MKHLIGITCLLWSLGASAAEPAAQQPATQGSATQEPGQEQKPQAPVQEDLSATAEPRVNTSSPSVSPTGGTLPAARDERPAATDRLQLDTTIVTGNRELPKVLYIVPWKKADIGELPSQPFNSLLDEILQPLDRDVFRREVNYYGVVSGNGAAPGQAGTAAQSQTAPAKQ
jgi:hypothetical protein